MKLDSINALHSVVISEFGEINDNNAEAILQYLGGLCRSFDIVMPPMYGFFCEDAKDAQTVEDTFFGYRVLAYTDLHPVLRKFIANMPHTTCIYQYIQGIDDIHAYTRYVALAYRYLAKAYTTDIRRFSKTKVRDALYDAMSAAMKCIKADLKADKITDAMLFEAGKSLKLYYSLTESVGYVANAFELQFYKGAFLKYAFEEASKVYKEGTVVESALADWAYETAMMTLAHVMLTPVRHKEFVADCDCTKVPVGHNIFSIYKTCSHAGWFDYATLAALYEHTALNWQFHSLASAYFDEQYISRYIAEIGTKVCTYHLEGGVRFGKVH